MSINDHLESIVNEIQDYRLGEIDPIDEYHVEKWLNQFDKEDRITIASEMDHIVHNYYLTKTETKDCLKTILADQEICGDLREDYRDVKFLKIQRKGESQNEILELINEILIEDYQLNINILGSTPKKYIYIDDCLFSGNTLFYDLKEWSSKNKDISGQLNVVYLVCYSRGFFNTRKRIDELFNNSNISPEYFRVLELNNLNNKYKKYECCWSIETPEPNDDIKKYLTRVNDQCKEKGRGPRLYREHTSDFKETLFSCYEGRLVVEKAFLKYGAYITGLPKNLQYSMRPLGYEKFESLGFGAMFITYRNIANNCPSVLWWGDTTMQPSHPFSKWHPLFPRKTNENSERLWM